MEYIGWTLASAAVIDPERAVFATAGALVVGLVIFLVRNKAKYYGKAEEKS